MPITHTPAPWSVGRPDGLNRMTIEPTIGVVFGGAGELGANAKLVAAAPALVAALKALYYRFPCNDDLIALGWDQKRIDLAESEMDAARKALIEAGAIKC